jgi:hypothetical protein
VTILGTNYFTDSIPMCIYTSVFIRLNPSYTTYIMITHKAKRQHVSTVNSHHEALLNSFVNYNVSAHMGSHVGTKTAVYETIK